MREVHGSSRTETSRRSSGTARMKTRSSSGYPSGKAVPDKFALCGKPPIGFAYRRFRFRGMRTGERYGEEPEQIQRGQRKTGCPVPDSPPVFSRGRGGRLAPWTATLATRISAGCFHRASLAEGANQKLFACRRDRCGSLLTRRRLASEVVTAPLAMPSGKRAVFEQSPRRSHFCPSLPSVGWGAGNASALSYRFSWFCPRSGHPSSFFGIQRLHLPNSIPETRKALSFYFSFAAALRARTLNQMGDPSKPKASRI